MWTPVLLLTLPENRGKHTCPPGSDRHQRVQQSGLRVINASSGCQHCTPSHHPPERSLYALSALNHQCWVHLKHSLMTWHGSLTNPQVSKQLLDTVLHPRVQRRSSWRVIKMCRGIPLRDSNTSTMCLWTWTQASVCKYSAEHRVRMGVK